MVDRQIIGNQQWVAVIMADGAGSYQVGAQEYSGGGLGAARIACQTTTEVLQNSLGKAKSASTAEIIKALEQAFSLSSDRLKENNQTALQKGREQIDPGGTTLLIALLAVQNIPFWFYGYLGNGQIVLMSPQRMIGEYLSEVNLLTPQEGGGGTVTLPHSNTVVKPVIGLIPYQINDCLFLATDGMNAVDKYLRQQMGLTLANYLWKNLVNQAPINALDIVPDLPDIRNDPNIPSTPTVSIRDVIRDDATLALIWTRGKQSGRYGLPGHQGT
ncbi:MAG: protein phosphatase 2C domain-containing protein [Aggregatilineales bacterium]